VPNYYYSLWFMTTSVLARSAKLLYFMNYSGWRAAASGTIESGETDSELRHLRHRRIGWRRRHSSCRSEDGEERLQTAMEEKATAAAVCSGEAAGWPRKGSSVALGIFPGRDLTEPAAQPPRASPRAESARPGLVPKYFTKFFSPRHIKSLDTCTKH
jgi:hypothetical protein